MLPSASYQRSSALWSLSTGPATTSRNKRRSPGNDATPKPPHITSTRNKNGSKGVRVDSRPQATHRPSAPSERVVTKSVSLAGAGKDVAQTQTRLRTPAAPHKWATSKKSAAPKAPVPTPLRTDNGFERVQKSPEKLFHEIREEMEKLDGKEPLSSLQVVAFNHNVADLRTRLSEGDVLGALAHWQTLRGANLLPYLGPNDLDFFVRTLSPLIPRPPAKWESAVRDAVQEMAVFAAAGGYAGPLKECMLYHIRKGDAIGALALYSHHRKTTEAQNTWISTEEDDADTNTDDDSLVSIAHRDPVRYSVGAAELLLCAIAAHAMQDSFHPALNLHLEASIHLTKLTSETFLTVHLADQPELQDKLRFWLRHFETARLVSRPSSLARQIANFVADNNLQRLQTLYTHVCAGFMPPSSWLAAVAADVSPTRPVLMLETTWASFITAFIRCGSDEHGAAVWDDMTTRGLTPGVIQWTAVIDGQGESGAVDKAVQSWKSMLASNVVPDAMAYRAIIGALFKRAEWAKAMKMFEEFTSSELVKGDKAILVYNLVLRELLAFTVLDDKRERLAIELFDRMQEEGPKPDIVTYNTLLAYYGRRNNLKALARYLQIIHEDESVAGDVFTYSTILSALLRVGRSDAAALMFNVMQKQGVAPNVATFTSIIRSIMQEKDERHVKACLDIIARLEADDRKDMHPNVITYKTLLHGIVRGQFLPDAIEDEYVQSILRRMEARDIQPNGALYNLLISASLAKNADPGAVSRALGYYKEMRRRQLMTRSTWYVLLEGLLRHKEVELANEIVGDMLRLGVVPAGPLHKLVTSTKMQLRAARR